MSDTSASAPVAGMMYFMGVPFFWPLADQLIHGLP
jgi:hypothetical protein